MKINPYFFHLIIFLIVVPIILFIFRELKTPITSSTPASITSTSKLSNYCVTEGIDESKCFNNLDFLLENEEKKAKQKKSFLERELNRIESNSLRKYYALDGSIVGSSNYGRKTNVKLKSFTDLPKEPNKQFFQSNYIIRGVLEIPDLSLTESEKEVLIIAEHDYKNYSPPLGFDRSEIKALYIEEFGFASRDFDALEVCEALWRKVNDTKNHICYGKFLISFVPMETIKFDDTKEAGYFIGSSFKPTLEAYSIKAKSIETQVANQLSQGKKYVKKIFQEHHINNCLSSQNTQVKIDINHSDGIHINTECSENMFLSEYILYENQYVKDETTKVIINKEILLGQQTEINNNIKCPEGLQMLKALWKKKHRYSLKKEKIRLNNRINELEIAVLKEKLEVEINRGKRNEILNSIDSFEKDHLRNSIIANQSLVSYVYSCK